MNYITVEKINTSNKLRVSIYKIFNTKEHKKYYRLINIVCIKNTLNWIENIHELKQKNIVIIDDARDLEELISGALMDSIPHTLIKVGENNYDMV